MMLNPSIGARRVAARVTEAAVIAERTICPELLRLNESGFLNGHTPFSAYLAFLGAACLFIYGYKDIIVANERSSEESNAVFRSTEINHQYSKTLRFETRFDEYLQQYLATSARYFSLVRPLYELQIAQLFSRFPEFFADFKSCNRHQRQNSWCGECPKCVSVFVTMYPFVQRADLTGIFGADLFEKATTIPVLASLAGLDAKPFECVATRREILAALSLALENAKKSQQPLPRVLQYALENFPGVLADGAVASDLLRAWGPHRLPEPFERLLRASL